MNTPYGLTCQFRGLEDGRGKFRAALAQIYANGMSAQANDRPGNPHRSGTKKCIAWDEGWRAGVELSAAISRNKAGAL